MDSPVNKKVVLLITTISSFLAPFMGSLLAFSFSETELLILRIFQGIGAAMIFGTSVAILTSVYPPGERGKALGISVAGVYLGLSLGPVIGGFLTEYYGWRGIFLSYVPLELIIIVLTFWKLKGEWADAKGECLDIIGSRIYNIQIKPDSYSFFIVGEKTAFIVFASLCFIGIFASFARGKVR